MLRKTSFILLLGIIITNCSTNRTQVGAVMGATTTTATCVELGANNPGIIATCAVAGAFAGAESMYNSDYDVHNAVFVDHLNNGPGGSSYTNWYNQKTLIEMKKIRR